MSLDPRPSDTAQAHVLIERKRTVLNRLVLLVLIAVILMIIVPMLKMFLTPLVLACTFASLFFPLYSFLRKSFRGNSALASLVCCALLVLGFVIPAYFLGYLVTRQLLSLYQSFEPMVMGAVRGDHTGLFARFDNHPAFVLLSGLNINWQSTLMDIFKSAGTTMTGMVNKTSMGVLEILVGMFLMLFIMFYLFMDGQRIVLKFRELLPLRTAYQNMIITRFLLVSRATVKGTLVIALVQGTLGAIILLVFGVKTWLLWGVVMIACSMIPMMGPWLVLIPAALFQIASGNIWQGIVILALSFGVVSTIDNILRPRLVGQSARMHDLLIFFSTIGGLAMFGPVGVIIGPVVMAFFVAITEIYAIELNKHLTGIVE